MAEAQQIAARPCSQMFTLGSQRQGLKTGSHATQRMNWCIALGGRAKAHHRAPERNRKTMHDDRLDAGLRASESGNSSTQRESTSGNITNNTSSRVIA